MKNQNSERLASRRDFLGTSLGALGAMSVLRHGQAASLAPRNVDDPVLVVVNLIGGNDGLNTVVPITNGNYYSKRQNVAIRANEALSLDFGPHRTATSGLHPSLVGLHQLWGQDQLAIVHRVGHPSPTLSHFESQATWSTLRVDDPVGSGWIARYKDRYARELLGAIGIQIGGMIDFSGGKTPSLLVNSIAEYQPLRQDQSAPKNHFLRQKAVLEMLERSGARGSRRRVRDATRSAFEIAEKLRGASGNPMYPQTRLGTAMSDVAAVLAAGFKTRVLYTTQDGYDTHASQRAYHADLMSDLDGALNAFAFDMRNRGLWDRVIVAVISEFGRSTNENSTGTDHGSGSSMLLTGGAVRGGEFGNEPDEQALADYHMAYEIDFRSIYWELIRDHLGDDPKPVFPDKVFSKDRLGLVRRA